MRDRFCPDVEKIKDKWVLSRQADQGLGFTSYFIEIVKCKPIDGIECYPDKKIEKLLSYMSFNLNSIESIVNYEHTDGQHPLHSEDVQDVSVDLEINKYVRSQTFLSLNKYEKFNPNRIFTLPF